MARPAKSVKVKTGAIAAEDQELRQKAEDEIRGEAVAPEVPSHLTENQREIFRFICQQLEASKILGKLDVYVLEATAVSIDRLHTINSMIDADPDLLTNTALQNSRAKYQSDLWRGCNELCLSPQARAKLGGLAAQKAKKEKDPLLEALSDDD